MEPSMDKDESMGDFWRDVRKAQQQFRAKRRVTGAQALTEAGVPFTVHNGGAHLIVADRYDFWPGTGRWSHRDSPRSGRGVDSLLRNVKASP
jgi:hypothetical protein